MCLGSRKHPKGNRTKPNLPTNLNVTFWNIQGIKSKIVGNKLADPDFLNEVKNADIIGLAETHIHEEILDELIIPGFVPLDFKNRPKNAKSNISSGGIAIFAKEPFQSVIQPIYTENQDIVWIKFGKRSEVLTNDVYLGTIYYSPNRSEIRNCEKISKLAEEITNFNKKGGEVILQGDFNARTSNRTDTVEPDKFDPVNPIMEKNLIPINSRNSKDSKLDSRGRELLDLCKSLDLNIVNGRKTGDIFGDFTSFQWNGNALVDYLITSKNLFTSILSMNVGNFMPWISDHCALHFKLQSDIETPKTIKHNSDLYTQPGRFYWDLESTQRFLNYLKSEDAIIKLSNIYEINNPNDMAANLNEALKSFAFKCKIKISKSHKNKQPNTNLWYDKECINVKLEIERLAKHLKKDPLNKTIKETIYVVKKSYKSLLKRKKKTYHLEIMNKLNLTKKSSKCFWKLLDKLIPNKVGDSSKSGISANKWLNHFESIFTTQNTFEFPNNPDKIGLLDSPISHEELIKASYALKLGKSPGFDSISNEMILCLLNTHPETILKLFNEIFAGGTQITAWNIALINPIHKKGSKFDPLNYRGISLLSCFGKYFTAILNTRLLDFSLKNNILSKEQMGFIPGNRTSDAFIVLYNLINNYCHTKNKFIHGCFVDFTRAFDSVPRPLLFEKLIKYNITGKFYENIKNLYTNDRSCVKIGDKLTDTFENTQGVKQGCILSPLLFNIFLADLPKIFKHNLLKINDKDTLSCVIWADDLLILSDSQEGLNNMLGELRIYCNDNTIEVNIAKTKCMIFNKTGRHIRKTFLFGKQKIDTTREYKYLGLLITPSLNLSSALENLKDRASRSYYLLKTKLGEHFKRDITTTIYLFNMLVKPILLYGSDYWGCLKLPRNNPIEILYMKFCKELLGVQKQTTNAGVLLELGLFPLYINARKSCVKNWERIAIQNRVNQVTKTSYEWALKTNSGWTMKVKDYLAHIGYLGLFLGLKTSAGIKAFCREKDIFLQTEFFNMQKDSAKLRTYSTIKTKIGMEDYLLSVHNIADRISLSKLRLSNHKLSIEFGRHKKIEKQLRVCQFCPSVIEDEVHFITACPAYHEIRENLFAELPTLRWEFRADKFPLFKHLMTNKNAVKHTAKFIAKAFSIREFLMARHSNHM